MLIDRAQLAHLGYFTEVSAQDGQGILLLLVVQLGIEIQSVCGFDGPRL
jgi:hypothetical protein